MATVFTLAGFGGLPQQLNQQLGGEVTDGNTVVPVWYNNFNPSDAGLDDGVAKLDAALHSVAGDKVVFAHSFGAIVCCRWLAQKGPTSDIPPSDVKFILIGNSVRRYGGVLNTTDWLGNVAAEFLGMTLILAPKDTPYTVVDIARQYDGFADVPPDSAFGDANAVSNVLAGQGTVHPDYSLVSMNAVSNTTFVEGNITYVLCSPTYPLPMYKNFAWNAQYASQLDSSVRPEIEALYDRPMAANTPPVYRPLTLAPSVPTIGANGMPDPATDPLSAYRYLDAIRHVKDTERMARPLIRLWDASMNYIGTVASERSVDAEEMMHDTGLANIEIMANDWLMQFLRTDLRAQDDLHITIDPYPNNRSWRWRYGAKVTNVRVKRSEDGIRTAVFECSHNREHWKHLLFGATPYSPPEVQPIKAWVLPGNTRTIVMWTAFLNLARNYWPLLSIPSNIFNVGFWMGLVLNPLEGAANPLNINPLNWPVQMQFVNPLFDQSRFSVIMSRWSNAHDVCEAMLKDAGCMVRAYTWLPEDKDSPHPELAALIGNDLARPTRACIVLAVEDKSGRTGLTGTAVDGILQLVTVTADDLLTESVYNIVGDEVIDPRNDSVVPPLIEEAIGEAPSLPTVAFRDGDYSAIISSEHASFRSKAVSIWTGGKSPGWVNQLQTFAIRYAISELCQVVTADGPGGGAGEIVPAAGFDQIYQGQFDDMLLSFIRYTEPSRYETAGPYAYLEHFEQGTGSAYTISSTLTLRQGLWRTRPYQAFKVSVRNGYPNTLYYDFDLGDRVLFQVDNVMYSDQVTAVKLHYDRDTPKGWDLSIGEDGEMEDPLASVTRTMGTFWNALSMLFGSGDLF